jgi:polyisoprenoid-binding protein YceI
MVRSLVKRCAGLLLFVAVGLVVAACGAPSTTSSAAPTAAPIAAPTTAPATAAAAAPTTVSAPATGAAPTTVSTPATGAAPTTASATDAGAASNTTLVIDPQTSKASYHAHEQLVGRTLPSEAVGTSNAVSGSLVLGPDGSIASDQSKITVDLSKLQSDESRRDNFIKGSTLQTNRYPMATFVPRQAQGLPSPLPTDGEATFQLVGALTVHGVTRPVTWQVDAQFGGSSVSGSATTSVNISDFGMSPPKAGPVLSIEDGLTLELAFTAERQA